MFKLSWCSDIPGAHGEKKGSKKLWKTTWFRLDFIFAWDARMSLKHENLHTEIQASCWKFSIFFCSPTLRIAGVVRCSAASDECVVFLFQIFMKWGLEPATSYACMGASATELRGPFMNLLCLKCRIYFAIWVLFLHFLTGQFYFYSTTFLRGWCFHYREMTFFIF